MKGSVTSSMIQGPREYQEDRHFYKRIEGPKFYGWLLAVMDGHIGSSVAELCVKEIEGLFNLSDANHTEKALRDLVSALNLKTSNFYEGSTLSVACILESHNKVSVAVLGDSPVIVVDKNGKLHVSPEHNIRSNIEERKAAEKRGGVCSGGYLYTQNGDQGLQMSRALGDSYLEGVISRKPDIYTIQNPSWVLVASDGLIDPSHKDSENLYKKIKKYADKRARADDLMQWVTKRGPKDNVTAIVWSRCK